ncbi:PilZ domain-containing protein [Vibrio sp. T187]|uniref:PilZ domain-containing protein n=1 Tax=Vibrio TaxID=662 RepID=UPI0010C9D709|nr:MULTISPECIES: PilZ domain-containing protein [Vibrio]MBW3694598.1 PilZ domain-containing protein [Vibrio sp. T187]
MTEQEFFTVHHSLTVNIEPLAQDFVLPAQQQFEAEIPAPFIVASEFSQLDLMADSARLELKNSDLKHVINLLDTQNSKLNLLLSFMLAQQDDVNFRTHTFTFGASQFSYRSKDLMKAGDLVRAKLFLEYPAAAIYCYAEVTECNEKDTDFEVSLKYLLLRDADQDLLIKAALHQQQKLLRQRSIERDSK